MHETHSPRRVSSNQDKRATSIFKQTQKSPSVSHLPVFNFTIDKENKIPQIRTREQFQSQNAEPMPPPQKRFLELRSRENHKRIYKFPLYNDKEIGIQGRFSNFLCESYNDDDDIDTKQSVMEYFVEVCRQDLLEGIRMNSDDFVPASFNGKLNSEKDSKMQSKHA